MATIIIGFFTLISIFAELAFMACSVKKVGYETFVFNLTVGGAMGLYLIYAFPPLSGLSALIVADLVMLALLPATILTLICVIWEDAKSDPFSLLNTIKQRAKK